jgi:hypothetical protein
VLTVYNRNADALLIVFAEDRTSAPLVRIDADANGMLDLLSQGFTGASIRDPVPATVDGGNALKVDLQGVLSGADSDIGIFDTTIQDRDCFVKVTLGSSKANDPARAGDFKAILASCQPK